MNLWAWCIMSSHMHLIFRAGDNNPSLLLKELKPILPNNYSSATDYSGGKGVLEIDLA
jgi:hypothetical protein